MILKNTNNLMGEVKSAQEILIFIGVTVCTFVKLFYIFK